MTTRRPAHSTGGGWATPHENGDTAVPYPIYHDWKHDCLTPFGRRNGVRYETDPLETCRPGYSPTRRGVLFVIVEGLSDTCYGVPRENLYITERPNTPKQCHVRRGEALRQRRALTIAYVRLHPGVTKHDIRAALGEKIRTIESDLHALTRTGELRQEYKYQRSGKAASKYHPRVS